MYLGSLQVSQCAVCRSPVMLHAAPVTPSLVPETWRSDHFLASQYLWIASGRRELDNPCALALLFLKRAWPKQVLCRVSGWFSLSSHEESRWSCGDWWILAGMTTALRPRVCNSVHKCQSVKNARNQVQIHIHIYIYTYIHRRHCFRDCARESLARYWDSAHNPF